MTNTEQKEQLEIPNEHPEAQTVGEQYRMFGFLPGGYVCTCKSCAKRFIGAKRSFSCLDCARKLEKESADKGSGQDSFEGCECTFTENLELLIYNEAGTLIDVHIGDQGHGGEELQEFVKVFEEFARRWNAFPTLRKEMNELSDRIVATEMASDFHECVDCSGSGKIGPEDVCGLCEGGGYVSKKAEITRLRKENERLGRELAESRAALQGKGE